MRLSVKSKILYSSGLAIWLFAFMGFLCLGSPGPEDPANRSRIKSENSVFSENEWYKIAVAEDGIYKIDFEFLNSMGLDPTKIDPATIRVLGNGGKMLPQDNKTPRYEGPMEIDIEVISSGTRFNHGDYVIFYGQGPDTKRIRYDSGEIKLDYEKNIFSDTSYYFLTFGGSKGKRIEITPNQGVDYPLINSFTHIETHELDQFNIVNSGRDWYGEKFDLLLSQSFDFYLPGILANSIIHVQSAVMAKSRIASSFDLVVNGITIGTQNINAAPNGTYTLKGRTDISVFDINSSLLSMPDNKLILELNYNKPTEDNRSAGYLNYFTILCERQLKLYTEYTFFRSPKAVSNPYVTYELLPQGKDVNIWEISDPLIPQIIEYELLDEKIKFGAKGGQIVEYVVFNKEELPAPVFSGKVKNQNLAGSPPPELLIVTHSDFLSEADRLADFRETNDGLSVKVVTAEQIYNEFSSGSQDVTAIRDYVKYLYEMADPDEGLKYLLLFGRGSFDYKARIDFNTNYVPIYQSRNSLHPIYSYSSDDYFTFLEEDEGEWIENDNGYHTMDIGVGRLPVVSVEEARAVVDKLIIYSSNPKSYGRWRNEIVFVADDGDGVDGIIHSKQADELATFIDSTYSDFNINKIYVDAYPQIRTPNKQIAPEVNQAINDAISKGTLIMNFTGHGAESGWTAETILDIVTITGWDNLYRLPLLVTATCEFGRNDNPRQRSGAEFAIINPNGGAIGLVTTSRPVFSNPNYELNLDFYKNVFEKRNGKYHRLGDIFRFTKNLNTKVVTRNFTLLGDPSMKLAYPDKEIVITHINESEIDKSDTLKALKKAVIKGNLSQVNGEVDQEFEGILTATVYDKPLISQTLGTEDPIMTYEEKEVVFRGDVSVRNGQFEFEFIMPRNISYHYGDGKISLYAISSDNMQDAAGSNGEIKIGGSEQGVAVDDLPPEIELYMNDTTFNYGGRVGTDPILVAKIFDENGITISGSEIGQGMLVTLDNDKEIDVSSFYKSDIDSYQSGTLRYPFAGLSEGNHMLALKVWDTHNNSSEAILEFVVADKESILIQNLLNYPNPFRDETVISFEHNRSGEDLEFAIEIFNINGQVVKKYTGHIRHSEFRVNSIKWDGRNSTGEKMRSGIYIYRVFVRSLRDGAKNYEYDKMVIIN